MKETTQNPSEKTSAGKTSPQITFTAMEQIVTSWTGGYGTHSLTLLTNVDSKSLPVRLRRDSTPATACLTPGLR